MSAVEFSIYVLPGRVQYYAVRPHAVELVGVELNDALRRFLIGRFLAQYVVQNMRKEYIEPRIVFAFGDTVVADYGGERHVYRFCISLLYKLDKPIYVERYKAELCRPAAGQEEGETGEHVSEDQPEQEAPAESSD